MKIRKRLIIFSSGFMQKHWNLFNNNNIFIRMLLYLLVISCLFINAKTIYAIEIIKAEFIDKKNSPLLTRYGYNYGIIVRLESKTDNILDEDGQEIVPVEFLVSKEDDPEHIVAIKKFNQYTSPEEEDPKKVDYFLIGPFAPELDYVLSINWRDETKSIKISSSLSIKEEMTTDEEISSWISNKFDFDFSFRPITNQKNIFASDIYLKMYLFKIKSFSPEILIDATVATDDTVKNGYKFNLNLFKHSNVFSRNLGKLLGNQYYYYEINASGNIETNQKWDTRRYHIRAKSILEIPYTNIFSLLVHQQHKILRTAPGLIFSLSYLKVLDHTEGESFAKKHRIDIEGYYNITLSPILFTKIKVAGFYDPENSIWKSYQEYQIAVKFDSEKNTYYFMKYIKGYNPPVFNKEVDEVSIGVATKF